MGTIHARGALDEDWWNVPMLPGRVIVWVSPQECATAQNLDIDLYLVSGSQPLASSANPAAPALPVPGEPLCV